MTTFTTSMNDNKQALKSMFNQADDLKWHEFDFGGRRCQLCFLATTVDKKTLHKNLLAPLLQAEDKADLLQAIPITGIERKEVLTDAAASLVKGNAIILLEGDTCAYAVPVPFNEDKTPDEPQNEKSVTGGHIGFVESLETNIALIRKYIVNDKLAVRYSDFGQFKHTQGGLLYLEHAADSQTVSRIASLLADIKDTDLNTVQQISRMFMEKRYSPFPQIMITERLDRVLYHLGKGKAVIILNGSPSAAILPVSFFNFFESTEDFMNNIYIGNFFYHLRVLGFLISIMLPALYISVVAFHSDILPASVLYNFKLGTEFVPFHPLVEAILMQVILELLREAAIRLPTSIASTIGVVGGLVIGNAIVEVNFVSMPMIIVIAITALASFCIPIAEMSSISRLMGFTFMLAATLTGFLGVSLVFIIMLIHLCAIEVLGVPYFTLKDILHLPGLEQYQKLKSTSKTRKLNTRKRKGGRFG
ncbi:spore germination protein [Paenibacillus montanisoli]|uniref:Spore germination protein n=1 Tax=Paenibacillus montanisoli TaxID=2081970 RepID=A0A328TYN8_9BACL|nr:spore germination protein [Paenibacillus montanisoli]RAP75637.1 spore germination protein [Paenibacillus montanisoli]